MSKPRSWSRKWVPPLGVLVVTAGGALGLLLWWHFKVDDWAAKARIPRTDSCEPGEVRDYSVPGTFGDAFAPIVGVMTALALGATVASGYMQREEMEEAREQFTAQARALDRANELANESNDLQRSAQVIEALRQIAEIDRVALALITVRCDAQRQHMQKHPGPVGLRGALNSGGVLREPFVEWDEYWKAPSGGHRGIDSPELRTLAKNRLALVDAVSRLNPSAVEACS